MHTIEVKFQDIAKVGVNGEFLKALLESPELFLLLGKEVLRETVLPKEDNSIDLVNLRIKGISDDSSLIVGVKDLKSKHIGRFVGLAGYVRKVEQSHVRFYAIAFSCSACGELTVVLQHDRNVELAPLKCSNYLESEIDHRNVKFKLERTGSKYIDSQEVIIGNEEGSAEITALLEDELTDELHEGESVVLNGIFILEPKGKARTEEIFYVNSIENVHKENSDLDIDILFANNRRIRGNLENVFDIIRELQKDNKLVPLGKVIERSIGAGLTKENCLEAIRNLKAAGQIYEPVLGELQIIK